MFEEEPKLMAFWTNKVGNQVGHNFWKVVSDIEFADGRVKFTISNGSHVDIDVNQMERIRMVVHKKSE